MRNELVYRIHSLVIKNPLQYKQMLREVEKKSNPFAPSDYSLKFSFLKKLHEDAAKKNSAKPSQRSSLDDLKRKYKKRGEKNEDSLSGEDELTLMTMNLKNLFLVYERLSQMNAESKGDQNN